MSSAHGARQIHMVAITDDIRALFTGVNTAHIATILPDGSPHSVLLWVGLRGDRIAFLTSRSSRKGPTSNGIHGSPSQSHERISPTPQDSYEAAWST